MGNVEIISGMNMNIVLELVIKNSSGCIDIDNALKEGKEGIQLKIKIMSSLIQKTKISKKGRWIYVSWVKS